MDRRTKIVCTLGPACSDQETIRQMIVAGMDVARLNFSHGTHEDHRRMIEFVRITAQKVGKVVPILQDLQGPKIRIGPVRGGGVLLHKGQDYTLTTEPLSYGDINRSHINYPTLPMDVEAGNRILIDDGLIELQVKSVNGQDVLTEVVVGGPLRSRKGVNLPHVRASSSSLTEKDIEDLEFGLENDIDIVALSFVRSRQDVEELMLRVRESGRNVFVIAKIEKPEAVVEIDRILEQADGIMVARGDLGIEMPLSQVPITQKSIIRKCLASARPVITATQMLESMMENPRPTRAEASDVANAVLDGSDAVMLSGETAAGKYPVRVIEVMAQIVLVAEERRHQFMSNPRIVPEECEREEQVVDAVSFTACQLADQVCAVGIACLTHSGATARAIARHRPNVPIYAFTDNERVVAQLGVVWGTKAVPMPFQSDTDAGVKLVHQLLKERGLAKSGDKIVITAGMPLPATGRTNMVHVSYL